MNDSVNPRLEQRRHNKISISLCAAGILVNILLGFLTDKAGLPLYFDTVGTVVVAALGGYLPGVIVGFLTNGKELRLYTYCLLQA